MDGMKNHDPFERRLRELPPATPPAGVYERLQSRASWNQPAPTHDPASAGPNRPFPPALILTLLAGLVFILLVWARLQDVPPHPAVPPAPHAHEAPSPPAMPEPEPEQPVPALFPTVVATTPLREPAGECFGWTHADPDHVGGLSSLLAGRQPPFAVPFDDPRGRPTLDDILHGILIQTRRNPMIKVTLLTLVALAILAAPTHGAGPGPEPTPNAAVGYLLALGWMEPMPDAVAKEINGLESRGKIASHFGRDHEVSRDTAGTATPCGRSRKARAATSAGSITNGPFARTTPPRPTGACGNSPAWPAPSGCRSSNRGTPKRLGRFSRPSFTSAGIWSRMAC
jgi:hypothetical protein